jgi:hypothetical protein
VHIYTRCFLNIGGEKIKTGGKAETYASSELGNQIDDAEF